MARDLGGSLSRRTVVHNGAKLAYAAPLVAASMSMRAASATPVSPGCLADGADCNGPRFATNLCGTCCSGASTYRGFGVTTCGACLVAGVPCRPDSIFDPTCGSCCNGYDPTTSICN